MNIALLSIADDSFHKFRDITFPNKAAYARRHGYHWMGETESRCKERSTHWSKILALKELCERGEYEWAFWTDADSLIMRMDWPLELILNTDADLVISKDEHGINSGVFALRTSLASSVFLDDVWNQIQFVGHIWQEQRAMMHLLDNGYPLRVSYPPKIVFNAYPDDFDSERSAIFHCPGNPAWANRVERLREKFRQVRG